MPLSVASMLSLLLLLFVSFTVTPLCIVSSSLSDKIMIDAGEQLGAADENITSSLLSSHCRTFSAVPIAPLVGRVASVGSCKENYEPTTSSSDTT